MNIEDRLKRKLMGVGNGIVTEMVAIEDVLAPDLNRLERAASILSGGGLVAFPTETVYGLGANALDEAAARRIYEAKGRPSDNPLIVHIADLDGLKPLVSGLPEAGKRLMEAFWPGPLTLVFPKSRAVPGGTTGGLDTVAVRLPSHPVARALIRLAGTPVAAPSANTSGRPSPTLAEHVLQDMEGRIDMIVDGGPVGIGLESTIIDVSGEAPVILRPGAVTQEMASRALGGFVALDPAISGDGPMDLGVRPKAPGMKYKHYAPKADLILVDGPSQAVIRAIRRMAGEELMAGRRVGIICTEESKPLYPGFGNVRGEALIMNLGSRDREEVMAHNLYGILRRFDDWGADIIYSEIVSADHLGQAIMNRLKKAAGYHIVSV